MSSLLGRSGTLKRGSTSPDRRYLRIVFRDSPVRRAISRIECPSRRCQRRITLSNAMSITPKSPAINQQGWVQTWVTSQWKNPSIPGQLSAEINTQTRARQADAGPDMQIRQDPGVRLDLEPIGLVVLIDKLEGHRKTCNVVADELAIADVVEKEAAVEGKPVVEQIRLCTGL